MINGYIKETLNLVGMEVHGDKSVDTSYTKQVGNKFGSDAHSGFVFTILSRPTKIWDDSIDSACRRSLCRVDHKQQLHEVVGVGKRALHQEDVASAD